MFWYRLLYGQLFALLTAVSTVCAERVSNRTGVAYTAIPSLCVYGLLAMLHFRSRPESTAHLPVFWYAMAALADVAASYFIFLSFYFAPIAQISLLEDAAIPFAFFIDYFLLRRIGTRRHFGGATLCTASIVFYAVMAGAFSQASTVALGIALPLLSALCYAVSNGLQVYLVELYNRPTYMWYLGVFGTAFSALFSIPLVKAEAAALLSTHTLVLLCVIIGSLLFIYLRLPHFISITSMTFFNMSLMTKNFYSLLASELIVDKRVEWYGYVAFVGIFASLMLFNWQQQKKLLTSASASANDSSVSL